MTAIDHAAFPHLFASIISASSAQTLARLRATCRDVRALVDAHIARRLEHITLTTLSDLPENIHIAALDGSTLPLPTTTLLPPRTTSSLALLRLSDLLRDVRRIDILTPLPTPALYSFCRAVRSLDVVRIHAQAVGGWNVVLGLTEPIGTLVIFAREPLDRIAPTDGFLHAEARKIVIRYPRAVGVGHTATTCLPTWIPWRPMSSPLEETVLLSSWARALDTTTTGSDGTLLTGTSGELSLAHAVAHLLPSGQDGTVALVDCRDHPSEEEMDAVTAHRIRQRVRMLYAAKRGHLRELVGIARSTDTSSAKGTDQEAGDRVVFMSLDEYATSLGSGAFELKTVLG